MKQETVIEAIMDVSEVELIYKSKVKASRRPKICQSKDAYDIFIKYWDKNKIEFIEQFYAMFLNRGNKVLGIYNISTGGITGTVVDPRIVFATALELAASGIILAHNHPSSNAVPSSADETMTKKMREGGKFLDIKILDHLIISAEDGYYSMSDEGNACLF